MSGFVYKWTNLINGKWYIGSHKGSVDDGYIASGVFIRQSIEKHMKNVKNRRIKHDSSI